MNSDIEPRDNLEITLISFDGVINTILTNFFYFRYMSFFKRCLILLKAYLISLTVLSQKCPHPITSVFFAISNPEEPNIVAFTTHIIKNYILDTKVYGEYIALYHLEKS